MKYQTTIESQLADAYTPVSIYAILREYFSPCLLLESSDYHTKENSYSIICCDLLEEFIQEDIDAATPDNLQQFLSNIQCQTDSDIAKRFNSVFGFTTYESVQNFETITFRQKPSAELPMMRYEFFRFILVFEHFTETLYWIENCPKGEASQVKRVQALVAEHIPQFHYDFKKVGPRRSNLTDEEYADFVRQSKYHCQIGDVFQIVPSRRFEQEYTGDNYLVYRTLRSINPSPFSFYFDYGDYQIFGASPEAQILVRNNKAEIHPIAGTFKRTGQDDVDAKEAARLVEDPKENAEHVMLVDLARNDLSRSAQNVHVDTFREIQFYSHIIHLVSKVVGELEPTASSTQLYADTFPAGTLSGAPKYRAMEIIDQLEPTERGIYGGAIGAFGLNGDINQAIGIRTFMARNGVLTYQAGAGIVIDSKEDLETQEVYHKLRALEAAMTKAEEEATR